LRIQQAIHFILGFRIFDKGTQNYQANLIWDRKRCVWCNS